MLSALIFSALSACHGSTRAPTAAPDAAAAVEHHHHELHLAPPIPSVTVLFADQRVDVTLAPLAQGASSIPLLQLWKAAFPKQDPSALQFDLFGSDGFHPASRPPCTRLLSATQLAAARLDVQSHDISFDDSSPLPGCYHVHGVVRIQATR